MGSEPSKHAAYMSDRASSRAARGLQNRPLLSILGNEEGESLDEGTAEDLSRISPTAARAEVRNETNRLLF